MQNILWSCSTKYVVFRSAVCDVIKSMASDFAEYSVAVEQSPGSPEFDSGNRVEFT